MTGQTAPHTPPPASSPGGFFDSVRRLRIWRSPDRWAGGVAAGIGRRYGLDPLLVRGLFVVATIFGGLGLVLYGLAWALLPEASDGRIHLEQAVRGQFDIALAGAAALLIVGLSRPVFWWGASWWTLPWVVALVAVVAVVLLSRDRTTGQPGPAPDLTSPAGHPAGPAPDAPPAPGAFGPVHEQTYPAGATPRPAYDIPEDSMSQTADPGAPPPAADPPTAADPQTMPLDDAAAHATADASQPATWEQAGWGQGSDGGGWGHGGGDAGWGGQTPPPPPVPPVPSPGSRLTSLVLAVALLGAAGIALAHHQGLLDANPWLVGGGAVLAVLGAGVLVSGLRGRSQGGIGVLALLVALAMVPAAAAAAALPGFARIGTDATTWAGDPTWAPTAADAEAGYSLVAGQLVVDLTQIEDDADVTVPVSVVFGNLYLIVPDDADVTVNAEVGAGEIVGPPDGDWSGPGITPGSWDTTSGVGISTTLTQDGDGPSIVVDAEVSFGQIHIEETS